MSSISVRAPLLLLQLKEIDGNDNNDLSNRTLKLLGKGICSMHGFIAGQNLI